MTKIIAPVEGYNGRIGEVEFVDGQAETDDINIINYCRSAGYIVDDELVEAILDETTVDARDAAKPDQVGSKLRDAAVDPRVRDFLAPINAGQADPHGPEVVAPEIHASETGPIVPGVVGDKAYQDAKESAVAEAVRVDQAPVPEVMKALEGVVEAEDTDDEVKPDDVDAELQDELEADDDDDDLADETVTEERTAEPGEPLPEIKQPDVEPAPSIETPDSVIVEGTIEKVEQLKGEALEKALDDAKLSKSGTADEKRQRLADHQAQG